MNDILTVLGSVITVLSFVYAVYANRKTARIVSYNREQSWEIYRQATEVLARYQSLQKSQLTDPGQIQAVAAGETAARELVLSAIRMIKRFEKEFTKEKINHWLQAGKLDNESHLKPFMNLTES